MPWFTAPSSAKRELPITTRRASLGFWFAGAFAAGDGLGEGLAAAEGLGEGDGLGDGVTGLADADGDGLGEGLGEGAVIVRVRAKPRTNGPCRSVAGSNFSGCSFTLLSAQLRSLVNTSGVDFTSF